MGGARYHSLTIANVDGCAAQHYGPSAVLDNHHIASAIPPPIAGTIRAGRRSERFRPATARCGQRLTPATKVETM